MRVVHKVSITLLKVLGVSGDLSRVKIDQYAAVEIQH